MKPKKRVLILIRDGWGHGKTYNGNAVFHANTPNHDFYIKNYPTTTLKCTGNAVGNPKGVQGGSEVGHLTMGAGRVVWQQYEMINKSIRDKSFFRDKELLSAINHCKNNNSNLHISGLFSDQGVHADVKHLFALLDMAKKQKFNRVYIHLILDGRDMPERSAIPLVKKLNKKIKQLGIGTIVSVIGRFYGMDRDTNWDRTEKCYFLMVDGKGFRAKTAIEAIKKSYARGAKTDYYVHPTLIVNKKNKPLALLKDMDALIFYNFRSDRARQITAMINDLDYYPKKLKKKVDVFSVGMCSYDSDWNLPVAFDAIPVNNNLGQVIAKNGLKQLRIAETEKYAHVTFFFNSEIEKPNKKEDRVMIPSPKVKSYDLQPEMSAYKITKKLRPFLGKYDLIVLNYANPDLVGHSGVFKATVKACSVVDECAGKVIKKALEKDYVIFLTADHGNADHMFYDNGQVDPSHGFNPVLLTLISDDEKLKKIKLKKGGQKDLAPTVLKVMGLKKPRGMTGKTLF